MRHVFWIKVTLLSALALSTVGFLGGCGSETVPDAGTSIKEDPAKALERQKIMEEQYKTKK